MLCYNFFYPEEHFGYALSTKCYINRHIIGLLITECVYYTHCVLQTVYRKQILILLYQCERLLSSRHTICSKIEFHFALCLRTVFSEHTALELVSIRRCRTLFMAIWSEIMHKLPDWFFNFLVSSRFDLRILFFYFIIFFVEICNTSNSRTHISRCVHVPYYKVSIKNMYLKMMLFLVEKYISQGLLVYTQIRSVEFAKTLPPVDLSKDIIWFKVLG